MALSVASVTFVYNAQQVISRQVDALLRQTRPLQEIIVVDNASTDETRELLAKEYPQVTVLTMPRNLGAAGAWAAGVSYAALEKKHDWVWSFDDDSLPHEEALAAMLDGIQAMGRTGDDVGLAGALPVNRATWTCYRPFLWRNGFVKMAPEMLCQPVLFPDVLIASGCLVRREMVQKIGLPRADFFMDIFDFEYCLRARSHGWRVALVTGARFTHEIGNTRKIRWAGYSRDWMNQTPWREYYISRNLAYMTCRLYPNRRTKRFLARYLGKHAVGVLLFSSCKLACLAKIAHGLRDGLRGRLGIRFLPSS